jgi:hypothetical protein
MRHIISLSTIPPRFGLIGAALASLLAQKARPEAIRLYIPRRYRRFGDYDGSLPAVPDGVTIVQVDDDLGPATKVLYAARDLRGQAVDILYCDDDRCYLPDWSTRLLRTRAARPGDAVAAAGRSVASLNLPDYGPKPQPQAVPAPFGKDQMGYQLRLLWSGVRRLAGAPVTLSAPFKTIARSGYVDIAEGFAGVAIRPDFLDDMAFEIPPVLWSVDDVWLSGVMARLGVRIWAEAGANRSQAVLAAGSTRPLFREVIEGANRDDANMACARHLQRTYGIWGGRV